ncbi:MAG: hypothetical protein M3O46_08640 [Myxococcota bacterium]|nr:hypothetical protein [Myxococcota bacterium]
MLGSLEASQSLARTADGSLKMTSSLKFPLASNSPAVLSVEGTAVLHSFRDQGSIVLQAGVLGNASLGLQDVDVDVDLNVGAVALSTNGKSELFEFPVELEFPFTIGPLPAYFKLGLSIELSTTLTTTSSARSHVHFHIRGSGGLQWNGTAVNGTGTLDSVDGTAPTVMDISPNPTTNGQHAGGLHSTFALTHWTASTVTEISSATPTRLSVLAHPGASQLLGTARLGGFWCGRMRVRHGTHHAHVRGWPGQRSTRFGCSPRS